MKDLTQGKPIKVILIFALPILFGNLLQLFYSLADTRIVGQFLGETSLSAVGATSTLSDLMISFINGITTGFSLVAAMKFGAKDEAALHRAIRGSVILGISISVGLSALCLIFLTPILRFLNVEEAILPLAKSYIGVILGGLIITALYNIMASTLRAVGDSVTPLIFLAVATISNVLLDIIFVAVLKTGVAGAAYATVLAQALSVVLCFIYVLRKYPALLNDLAGAGPEEGILRNLLTNGMSMGFMASFVCFGTVCIQTAINTFGQDIIVAHTAARKIDTLFFIPIFVTAAALATFCGQNRGAERWDRIREGIRDCVLVNWAINLISMAAVYTLADKLTRLLVVTDNMEIINTSVRYLRFNILFFPVVVVVVQFRNAMQGFGDTKTPIISSMLELIVKILVAVLLAPAIGYDGIIVCEPVAWAIMVIPLIIGTVRILKNR